MSSIPTNNPKEEIEKKADTPPSPPALSSWFSRLNFSKSTEKQVKTKDTKSLFVLDIGTFSIKYGYFENEKLILDEEPLESRFNLSLNKRDIVEAQMKTIDSVIKKVSLKEKGIVVVLPPESTLVKLLEVREIETEEKVMNTIPFEKDEFIYELINHDSKKLLIGTKVSTIQDCVTSVGKKHLSLVAVEPAATLLLNAFSEEGNYIIADIGAASTTLCCKKGNEVFTRNIRIGGQDFTNALYQTGNFEDLEEAEEIKRDRELLTQEIIDSGDLEHNPYSAAIKETLEGLSNELQSTLDYFFQEEQKTAKLILSGGGASLKNLHNYLSKKLSIKAEVSSLSGKEQTDTTIEPVYNKIRAALLPEEKKIISTNLLSSAKGIPIDTGKSELYLYNGEFLKKNQLKKEIDKTDWNKKVKKRKQSATGNKGGKSLATEGNIFGLSTKELYQYGFVTIGVIALILYFGNDMFVKPLNSNIASELNKYNISTSLLNDSSENNEEHNKVIVSKDGNQTNWTEKFIAISQSLPDNLWLENIYVETAEATTASTEYTYRKRKLRFVGKTPQDFNKGHLTSIANFIERLGHQRGAFEYEFDEVGTFINVTNKDLLYGEADFSVLTSKLNQRGFFQDDLTLRDLFQNLRWSNALNFTDSLNSIINDETSRKLLIETYKNYSTSGNEILVLLTKAEVKKLPGVHASGISRRGVFEERKLTRLLLEKVLGIKPIKKDIEAMNKRINEQQSDEFPSIAELFPLLKWDSIEDITASLNKIVKTTKYRVVLMKQVFHRVWKDNQIYLLLEKKEIDKLQKLEGLPSDIAESLKELSKMRVQNRDNYQDRMLVRYMLDELLPVKKYQDREKTFVNDFENIVLESVIAFDEGKKNYEFTIISDFREDGTLAKVTKSAEKGMHGLENSLMGN